MSSVETGLFQLSLETYFQISVSDGKFISVNGSSSYVEEFLIALNKLKRINDGDIKDENPSLLLNIILEQFNRCDFSYVEDPEFLNFIQVLSLWISSEKIDKMIKTELNIEVIDYISDNSVKTLSVLRNLADFQINGKSQDVLLSYCSFISPLLITISFSFKLNYSKSKRLIKILTLIVIYQLNSKKILFDELTKIFIVNSSTNIDVFDVFSKLWCKTLENTIEQDNLDVKFFPGPISILNRFHVLKNLSMSTELIDQLIPFDSNEFLLKLSKDLVLVYNGLKVLKSEPSKSVIYESLGTILEFLTTDYSCELVYSLIYNLELENEFIALQSIENQEFKTIVNYIIFKISHVLKFSTSSVSNLTKKILDTDIIDVIESSDFARFKIYFETIDNNLKIDFQKDFQFLFALESSLFYHFKQFNFNHHLEILIESGSYLSIEAVQNNIGFILQNSLLKLINPKKDIPNSFKSFINFKKYPPFPRSDFLDFEFYDSNKSQLNLKNFNRLIDSLQLNNSIIEKTLEYEVINQKQLGFVNCLAAKDLNLKFKSTDSLLDQTFVVLFTNFLIADELNSKSQIDSKLSPIFFNLKSISNLLKIQTFKIFDKIFQLYDSFGVYKLLKFIDEISLQDLGLQKVSITLLNHLFFHTDNKKFQTIASQNTLIQQLIKDYVLQWYEPSMGIYKEFNLFFNFGESAISDLQGTVEFDKSEILKSLGYNTLENPQINKLLNIVSPTSSSSSGSMTNFNFTNINTDTTNYSSANTTMNSSGAQYSNSYNTSNSYNSNDHNYSYSNTKNNRNNSISYHDNKPKFPNNSSGNQYEINSGNGNNNSNNGNHSKRISQPYYPSSSQGFNNNRKGSGSYDKGKQNDHILMNNLNVLKNTYNVNHNLIQPQATSAINSNSNTLSKMEQYYTN